MGHDVGEAGDTDEENEGGYGAFEFRFGVVVAKAHRGQGREREVQHDNQVLSCRLVLQIIVVVEGKRGRRFACVLRYDKPQSADEVGEQEDDEHRAEHSEYIHDLELHHNLVIILLLIAHLILVLVHSLKAHLEHEFHDPMKGFMVQ